jgi:hypothetical protein
MQYFEMIDGGGNNPYHLLFYMISNFLIADINKPITYYYPHKNCKFEDEMLALGEGKPSPMDPSLQRNFWTQSFQNNKTIVICEKHLQSFFTA